VEQRRWRSRGTSPPCGKGHSSALRLEVQATVRLNDDYKRRGEPQMAQPEMDQVMAYFRCEMKMVQAISMLKGPLAMQALEEQALRPNVRFTQMLSQVSAFELWDRIGANAQPAVEALGSKDSALAGRAEWMLVQAGPACCRRYARRSAAKMCNSASGRYGSSHGKAIQLP